MCNAYNHSKYCGCGFGGDTHHKDRSKGKGKAPPTRALAWESPAAKARAQEAMPPPPRIRSPHIPLVCTSAAAKGPIAGKESPWTRREPHPSGRLAPQHSPRPV